MRALLVGQAALRKKETRNYHQEAMKSYQLSCAHLLLYWLGSALRKASVEGYANIYSRTYCMNFMCDTKTNGGGWIVIQRRVYRDTYFNRTWQEYKHGFGAVCDDYWLGNENIYLLTSTGQYELRIDMESRSVRYFAEYREFYIDSESDQYEIHLNYFTGNVENQFYYHNYIKFSTPDRDNDESGGFCAGPNAYNTGW
ncbi:Angiopoietin- protein 2 [Bulinus truncatus]|nr:Angiopoietin- protein 2 [Bulinus truncatus]